MPANDSACRPIPKSVPDGTLAHKWCRLRGDRAAMHHSFKRWLFPGDYNKDELDRAIDASLKEHPDALEAFPEKIPVPAIEEEEAEAQARMKSVENSLKCFVEELAGGNVKLGTAQMLKWSPGVSEDEVRRAVKSVYGDVSV